MRDIAHSGPTFAGVALSVLRRWPERTAFTWDDGSITYAGATGLIGRMQSVFEKHGLRRGQCVAFLTTNRAESWCASIAAQASGLTITWLHPLASFEDHVHQLNDSGAAALVVDTRRLTERGGELSAKMDRLRAVFTIGAAELVTAFGLSQAVCVVAKLDIPTILAARGLRTIEKLAAEVNANTDALGRLIRFLASAGLFRTSGDQVEVTELGATLADGPRSMRYGTFYFMEMQYVPFGDLLHTVRTGESAATRLYGEPFFDWVAKDPARVEIQNRGFGWVTSSLREGMFDNYRLPEGAVVADIGGADSAMIARLLADEPDRKGIVFDLPEIVTGAAKTIADHGLAGRVQATGGDFFDSVPAPDVYILSTILYD